MAKQMIYQCDRCGTTDVVNNGFTLESHTLIIRNPKVPDVIGQLHTYVKLGTDYCSDCKELLIKTLEENNFLKKDK